MKNNGNRCRFDIIKYIFVSLIFFAFHAKLQYFLECEDVIKCMFLILITGNSILIVSNYNFQENYGYMNKRAMMALDRSPEKT